MIMKIRGLVTASLLGLMPLVSTGYSKGDASKPVVVRAGRAEYNQGNLVSYGFGECSAVVLDYGNSAIMAHAVPLLGKNIDIQLSVLNRKNKTITSGGVVDYLLEESAERGLNPKRAQAHVISGNQKSLERIVSDLKLQGIAIVQASLRDDKSTIKEELSTILYSPSEDKMTVFREGDFPRYEEGFDESQEWERS